MEPVVCRRGDERRAGGEIVGVGLSTFVEPSGGAGFESGTVRVERTGEITVLTGSSSHGQGHETVWAQIAAHSELVGQPLPVMDGLLMATAQCHGLTVVTRNVQDFALYPQLFNPWA